MVFDSGPLILDSGTDLMLIAVDNTAAGAAPVALLAADGSSEMATVLDQGAAAPAGLTAVHDGPDAPTVCVVADVAAMPETERLELFGPVSYNQFGFRADIPPGSYTIGLEITDAPATACLSPVPGFSPSAELVPGSETTAIVSGLLATGTLQLLALPDAVRPVATEAKGRLVHGSPSTPAVDIYLVAAGTDMSSGAVPPAFSGVEFGRDTGFVPLLPGDYDVLITLAGDTTPAIALNGVVLAGGDVLSGIARDPDAASSETAPGVILIDHNTLRESVSTD